MIALDFFITADPIRKKVDWPNDCKKQEAAKNIE